MIGDWLTTKEVAARLGVSDRRVRQLIAEGKLPAQKISDRQWLVKASALDKFERKRTLTTG